MCKKPHPDLAEKRVIGWTQGEKKNLPNDEGYFFWVMIKLCRCGRNMLARWPSGNVWVQEDLR